MLNQLLKSNRQVSNPNVAISLQKVVKEYPTAAGNFLALRGVDLQIKKGEFVAIVGKSGSGKSTLINMLTGIDHPSSGTVHINGTAIHAMEESPMAKWRGRNVGIIFQFFQLLPMLTCLENVMLPMDFCNLYTHKKRRMQALHLLEQVGLADHAHKTPSELSGGQQQRVAIARALATDAPVIVADEPTGNLDTRTADDIFDLFRLLVSKGKTIIMVTHDNDLARRVSRSITIADGMVINETIH